MNKNPKKGFSKQKYNSNFQIKQESIKCFKHLNVNKVFKCKLF